MNSRGRALLLLVALLSSGRGAMLAVAEDCADTDGCDAVESSETPFFQESSNHPGLLGKPYLDVRYHHSEPSDLGFVKRLDDSVQGFVMTTNGPLLALDELPGPIHYDFYTEFQLSMLNGEGALGPQNQPAAIDSDFSHFAIALTAYTDIYDPIRPFVQLGVSFIRDRDQLTVDPVVYYRDESETALLFNLGLEADLADRLAFRTQIDFNTRGDFDRSLGIAELIYWPLRRVYIRGGLFAPLEANDIGGLIGAGVVF